MSHTARGGTRRAASHVGETPRRLSYESPRVGDVLLSRGMKVSATDMLMQDDDYYGLG